MTGIANNVDADMDMDTDCVLYLDWLYTSVVYNGMPSCCKAIVSTPHALRGSSAQ